MRRPAAVVMVMAFTALALGAPAAAALDTEQVLCVTVEYDADGAC